MFGFKRIQKCIIQLLFTCNFIWKAIYIYQSRCLLVILFGRQFIWINHILQCWCWFSCFHLSSSLTHTYHVPSGRFFFLSFFLVTKYLGEGDYPSLGPEYATRLKKKLLWFLQIEGKIKIYNRNIWIFVMSTKPMLALWACLKIFYVCYKMENMVHEWEATANFGYQMVGTSLSWLIRQKVGHLFTLHKLSFWHFVNAIIIAYKHNSNLYNGRILNFLKRSLNAHFFLLNEDCIATCKCKIWNKSRIQL